MRWTFLTLALLGCTSAGDDAAKRYDIVAMDGDNAAKCAAARDAAAAYLKDQNQDEYRIWKLRSDVYCQRES
jgi:hypothetical protein